MPTRQGQRLTDRLYSLRGVMLLFVVAAILPSVLLAVFIAQQADRQLALAVREESLRLALLVAHKKDEVVTSARRLLEVLATLPSLADADPAACGRLLGTLVTEDSTYRNFAVIDAHGAVLCSAKPFLLDSERDGPWLEQVRQRSGFVVGAFSLAGPAGAAVLPLALALPEEEGRAGRALVTFVAREALGRSFAEVPVPEGTAVSLTDRRGTVLYQRPASADAIGRTYPQPTLIEHSPDSRAEVLELAGPHGQPYVYGLVVLAESGLRVIVATPRPGPFAGFTGDGAWPLAWLALAQLVILIAISIAARRYVVRPIAVLAAAAVRIGQGELSARSGLAPYGRDELGRLARVFDHMADSQQHRQEALEVRGAQAEARLRAALWASETGTFHWDLRSGRLEIDHNLARLFGLAANEGADSVEDFVARLHPDDRADVLEALQRCSSEGIDFDSEFRVVWPDGTVRWLDDKGKTISDAQGRPVSLTGACSDITQRKRYEEQQRLLVGELNHRVKNMLATVQSVMVQTLERSETPEAFAQSFNGRLGALARAHDLLTRSRWESAELRQLVEASLLPYEGAATRVRLDGPEVLLRPRAGLTMSMVLHELATNAAKYGALSVTTGRVEVDWWLDGSGHDGLLVLTWREAGGPAVAPPVRHGFGTHMIERSIAYELAGTAELAFPEDGLICTLTLPAEDNLLPQGTPRSEAAD